MPWPVILTFVATLGITLALLYAFTQAESAGVAQRLVRLWQGGVRRTESSFPVRQKKRVERVLAQVGKVLPPSPQAISRSQVMLMRAGYRSPQAIMVYRGFRVLVPALLVALVYFSGIYQSNPLFTLALALVGGYLAPEFWVTQKIRRRQHRLQLALPDGLDLMVISMEAGLGLDQAILRVAQELKTAHPILSEELQLVNMEMQLGKSRMEALRSLATRTGLEDVKALVAMLIQTDRFGTSLAQSLRVFSDDLRIKRRQRAEEMAAKTTVKMVPPLVFFIFPALMVAILGPGVIAIARQLMPMFSR